jgi:hypothetical protein
MQRYSRAGGYDGNAHSTRAKLRMRTFSEAISRRHSSWVDGVANLEAEIARLFGNVRSWRGIGDDEGLVMDAVLWIDF